MSRDLSELIIINKAQRSQILPPYSQLSDKNKKFEYSISQLIKYTTIQQFH